MITRKGLSEKEKQDKEAYYASLPHVKIIYVKDMPHYHVHDDISKDVMSCIRYETIRRIMQNEERLFTYRSVSGVGLCMELNDAGKNFFLELDVIDERIAKDYMGGRFESFDDETQQRRDISSIGRRTGIAQVVGGEKHTNDHNIETMFPSASCVNETYGMPITASDLFSPADPITIKRNGKPSNDTYHYVTRPLRRRGEEVIDALFLPEDDDSQ
jgi:hypothetical protein